MPNQNNNEEWKEELIEAQSKKLEKWGLQWNDDDWIDFCRQQISQAEQRGKREGLEEAEEIIANYAEEESESAILKRIRKKINQLK